VHVDLHFTQLSSQWATIREAVPKTTLNHKFLGALDLQFPSAAQN